MIINIYELLGMIKDDKAPKRIKFDENIYEYVEEEENYINTNGASINWDYVALFCLKEPVKIIEEEIPEKLNYETENMSSSNGFLLQYCMRYAKKIDEIIDYLRSKGE